MPVSLARCAVWLPVLMGIVSCRPVAEQPPNIIVVSIDTLNRSALQAFDASALPLPALDAFAEASIRFVNAYSTASWTLPAHASLLTGLYPDRHGANRERLAVAPGVSTVAEALRSRGYQTVAFADGGFLAAEFGFSRGFERYDDELAEGAEADAMPLPRDGKVAPVERRGESPFDRAIAFVSGRPADAGPLLLFLQTYTVHDYFAVREWALARLGGSAASGDEGYADCLQGRRRCTPQQWDRMRALYRAEVEHLDGAFGRLVAALERAELWNRSVVFFLSDHGEGFDFERHRTHHGGRLHADQLHVPLMVRVPGQPPREEAAPVSLVDLTPTILELTGSAPAADLDGRSFAAALRGEPLAGEARPLYAMEHNYTWSDEGVRRVIEGPGGPPSAVAVIEGRHWYIRGHWSDELYDMSTDGAQRRNLAPEARDLAAFRRLIGARSGMETAPNPIQPDAELALQLRSLGYAK